MASPAFYINARYQIHGKPVGEGGMGVVYKAYDIVAKRHVALKTMRSMHNPAALELFAKEWSTLANLSHPNIVDMLDTGEFEEDGVRRPFFVMPFLPGVTLEYLIENASHRLTVERIVEIVSQACRGLQAAHEHGLIHRDLKPSNIFVLEDNSVKIIDFGVVHLAGTESITGLKGTLQYMAPEQIELKPTSPASDIFSLGVVCYESLTGRKPFARKTEQETAQAIRRHIPPAVCELNPMVSQLVSRVIHKAMAKEPWHRFATAREFAETLQKALKNEPIERFDQARIQPRIERVKKAQAEGDHQFASEILTELEAEGHIDPEMTVLRMQIEQAIRQKSIRQLLDSARIRLEEDEFPLALQKIQDVLDLDPDNADALGLRKAIEKQRSDRQIETWFRFAEQHIHNQSFSQARQALQEILKINPGERKARELIAEVDRREQEINRTRAEKEQLYQSAVSAYQHGEVSSALIKLERVLELSRLSPESAMPDRDAQYQSFYNQIRTEREVARNLQAEARRFLTDRNFSRTLEICDEYLKKSPGDPIFQALKLEAEEQRRQEQSAYIAEVQRRLDSEPDLDRRVNILKEAVDRYPNEPHFQQLLRVTRDRRDLVNSIIAKAHQYEERRQYNDALTQIDILRNIYSQYPGLDFEVERLRRRRDEQAREEARARWVDQIDQQVAAGEYARSLELLHQALAEFPNDAELVGLERLAQKCSQKAAEAQDWLRRGEQMWSGGEYGESLEAFRKASALDERNGGIRAALFNALVEHARSVMERDWHSAEPLIREALAINETDPLAKNLHGQVLDYRRQEVVSECLSQARDFQAAGDLPAAMERLEEALALYPNEIRLVQLRSRFRGMAGIQSAETEPVAPQPAPAPVSDPEGKSELPESIFDQSFAPTITTSPDERQPGRGDSNEPAEAAPTVRRPPPGKSLLEQAGERIRPVLAFLQQLGESHGRMPPLQKGFIVAVPILILAAFVATKWYQRRATEGDVRPAVAEVTVPFEVSPSGATILIDGRAPATLPARLTPGAHKVEVRHPGFKSEIRVLEILPGAPREGPVAFRLEPELLTLRVSFGRKSGEVAIDGEQAEPLQDGSLLKDAISHADHQFRMTQSRREVLSFPFRSAPAAPPILMESLKGANEMDFAVIAGFGNRARVYSTNRSLKAGAGSSADLQPVPEQGLDLELPAGDSVIRLDDGKKPATVRLSAENAPFLMIELSGVDEARLQVHCDPPDADVFVNGRKARLPRTGVLKLEPGAYRIRVEKDGYEKLPEQNLELKPGEVRQVSFALKAIPRFAALVIEGGARGAEVLVDGTSVGRIGADGMFRDDNVAPGPHTITLKLPEHEDKHFSSREFVAGRTVTIPGADAQLIQWGRLEFRVVPPNATVAYSGEGEAQMRPANNSSTVGVRAGRYTVRASASGRKTRVEPVVVEPGKTFPVTWTLENLEVPRPAPVPAPKEKVTSDYFENPALLKPEGGWWHSGRGTTYFRANQGVFEFVVSRRKKVEFVIDDRKGGKIEYTLDGARFERKGKGGKKFEVKSKDPHQEIAVDISRERVIVKLGNAVVDEYKRENPGTPLGKFGFKSEVWLRVNSAPEK